MLHNPTTPNDAHPLTERLDLRENMARQQDRTTTLTLLRNTLTEYFFHERIEARSRFVQDQQFNIRGQCRDQGYFLAISLRVGPTLFSWIKLELFEQSSATTRVHPT